MSRSEIYDMSHPPPNWNSIDPYLDIKDICDNDNGNTVTVPALNKSEPDGNNDDPTVSTECYHLWDRKLNRQGL